MCVCVCVQVLKISFVGIVFVSYSDQLTKPDTNDLTIPAPLIGDLLALCGAVFYGCYTTLLKLKIVDESRIDMPLFFGFVGAFNVLFMWPFFIILHYTGLEKFELPFSPSIWVMIVLNAFIGTFLSDYLWLLSMLMTSPLVVTLGISLTVSVLFLCRSLEITFLNNRFHLHWWVMLYLSISCLDFNMLLVPHW